MILEIDASKFLVTQSRQDAKGYVTISIDTMDILKGYEELDHVMSVLKEIYGDEFYKECKRWSEQ